MAVRSKADHITYSTSDKINLETKLAFMKDYYAGGTMTELCDKYVIGKNSGYRILRDEETLRHYAKDQERRKLIAEVKATEARIKILDSVNKIADQLIAIATQPITGDTGVKTQNTVLAAIKEVLKLAGVQPEEKTDTGVNIRWTLSDGSAPIQMGMPPAQDITALAAAQALEDDHA